MNLEATIFLFPVTALVLLQIFADYVVKHVFKDGRTNEHKKFRTGQWYVLLQKTGLTEVVVEIPTVPV
jgi:hypothetical protein